MDRRRFLQSATAVGAIGLAGCSILSSGGGTVDMPRLGTDGQWVVDEEGNEVVLRGVNVVDPWWVANNEDVHGEPFEDTIARATDAEADWYSRVIRIPCQQRSVDEMGDVESFASEHVDPVIDQCEREGAYAIIDYHLIERYDTDDVDQRVRTFWETIAARYAERPHVLYELFNEPTQPADWATWKGTAQPWVDLVREAAPEVPIIVGSPQWTSMTAAAADDPFAGEDLIYAGHVYPATAPDAWEPNFGTPANEVPVMITEFGWLDVEGPGHDDHMRGTTSEWGDPFLSWLAEHDNVGWCAWAFDNEWDPEMFAADWTLRGGERYMGRAVRDALYERRDDRVPEVLQSGEATEPGWYDNDIPPAPHDGVSVPSFTNRQATVTWETTSDREPGVAYSTIYLNDEPTLHVEPGVTEAVVEGVVANSENTISVTATDHAGNESGAGMPVTFTTEPPEVHAEIPKLSQAPAIDGAPDEGAWADVASHPISSQLSGIIDDETDLSGEWKAGWDDEALYVLVVVTDGEERTGSTEPWNNDSVEIYIDGDNSRESGYDDENDFQLIYRRGESTIDVGENSVDRTDGIEQGRQPNVDGWILETAVPWDTVGVSPGAGDLVGFDVHLNDDDDGGDRDAKLAWHAERDQSWTNPSRFANVELVE